MCGVRQRSRKTALSSLRVGLLPTQQHSIWEAGRGDYCAVRLREIRPYCAHAEKRPFKSVQGHDRRPSDGVGKPRKSIAGGALTQPPSVTRRAL